MSTIEIENQINSELRKAAEKLDMERNLEGILSYLRSRDMQLSDVLDFLKTLDVYKKTHNGRSFKTYEKEFAGAIPSIADECFRGVNPIVGVGVVKYVWGEVKKVTFEEENLKEINDYFSKRIEETRL